MRDNIYATDSDRSVAYGHIQSQNCTFVDYRNWNSAKMGYTNRGMNIRVPDIFQMTITKLMNQ